MLKDYHRKFKYILVDEYQDTNTAQYLWLRLLAQRPQSKAAQAVSLRPKAASPTGRRPSLGAAPAEGPRAAGARLGP